MNLPAGLAVALGILTVLPLAAVVVGRPWRDPPPELWGISPERRAAAANSPELIAYRRRIELGIGDPRSEAVVDRAIRTGTAASPELRAATQELAAQRIGELDRRSRTARRTLALWLVLATVLLGIGVYTRHFTPCVYSALCCVRAYLVSPWQLRRLRSRAEAAVVANAAN